jgi:hypothetical protein
VDEKIDPKKGILAFGFCLKRFSEKKIPGIEEEDSPSCPFDLGSQRRFLGNTAERVPESSARLDLTHHIIRVEDAELGLWG